MRADAEPKQESHGKSCAVSPKSASRLSATSLPPWAEDRIPLSAEDESGVRLVRSLHHVRDIRLASAAVVYT